MLTSAGGAADRWQGGGFSLVPPCRRSLPPGSWTPPPCTGTFLGCVRQRASWALLGLLLLLVAGCAGTLSDAPDGSLPAAISPSPVAPVALAEADTSRLTLTLGGQATSLGYSMLPGFPTKWAADYPDSGSTVEYFIWEVRIRRRVPAPWGVPASVAEEVGMRTFLEVYISPADRDSAEVRVVAVDSVGRQSPWSEWSDHLGDLGR